MQRAKPTGETQRGRMSGRKNDPRQSLNAGNGASDAGSRRSQSLIRSLRRSAYYLRKLAEGTTAAEVERQYGVPPRTLNSVRRRAADALSNLGLAAVGARNAPLLARLVFREVFDSPEDLAFREAILDLLLKPPEGIQSLVDKEPGAP